MATHGRSGLNRFLLGSVTEKVPARHGKSIVVDPRYRGGESESEAMLKSIIVPLDGSELAEGVLPMAADMAKKLDLEVELFRAYHIPYNVYAGDEGFYAGNYEELLVGVRDEADEYLDKEGSRSQETGGRKGDVRDQGRVCRR